MSEHHDPRQQDEDEDQGASPEADRDDERDETQAKVREIEEDPSVNPPDPMLGDIRGG